MSKYISSRCVLCLEIKPLTEEHIFPDGVGGYLTADILCKDCNSNLGAKIDAPYLQQPHIQLARNSLRITGRRNHIPQPFSEIYEVSTDHANLRIRMDMDFKPRVIPDVSEIIVQPDDSLALSLTVDADARDIIPGIIRRKLERFFESPDGKALNWTSEQIENAITKTSAEALQAKAHQTPVGTLHGRFMVELKRVFLEHVKVAYEISCIYYKDSFIGTPRADEIRQFLYENSQGDKTETWSIEDIAKRLRILPQVEDSRMKYLIAQLTDNDPHAYHVALIVGPHVIVSMLGQGVVLTNSVDESQATPAAFFINDIRRKKCDIQAI